MKLFAIVCAVLVALCWGLYGPAVSNGRAPNREWGPFKPYVFIGLAYTVIAVFGSILMMKTVFTDNLNYTGEYWPAAKWGFLAGALGAVGALFLTFAFDQSRWQTGLCHADRFWRGGDGQRHLFLCHAARRSCRQPAAVGGHGFRRRRHLPDRLLCPPRRSADGQSHPDGRSRRGRRNRPVSPIGQLVP